MHATKFTEHGTGYFKRTWDHSQGDIRVCVLEQCIRDAARRVLLEQKKANFRPRRSQTSSSSFPLLFSAPLLSPLNSTQLSFSPLLIKACSFFPLSDHRLAHHRQFVHLSCKINMKYLMKQQYDEYIYSIIYEILLV